MLAIIYLHGYHVNAYQQINHLCILLKTRARQETGRSPLLG